MKQPLVSIVVPTYNRKDQLIRLLKSINQSDYPLNALEVIVIDNAADHKLKANIRKANANAKIIVPEKNLYSNGARKLGSAIAKGKYIFLLDDDNTLSNDCISALVDGLEKNSNLGIVGPVMLEDESDQIWSAGGKVTNLGTINYIYGGKTFSATTLPKLLHGIDYFPNACMVRREVLQRVPLDDETFPHNWAESDFCLRVIKAGYKIACVTSAIERHHIGYRGWLTRIGPDKTYDQAKSRIFFRRRHLSKPIDWAKFWAIVFPASTIVYFLHIIRSPKDRLKIFNAYLKGTYDGFSEPINNLPRDTGKLMTE